MFAFNDGHCVGAHWMQPINWLMRYRLERLPGLIRLPLLVLLMCMHHTVFSQATTKEDLQEIYQKYLVDEGFAPTLTKLGNVKFKREGKTYVIYVYEKDPQYFSIGLSFRVRDKSAEKRWRYLEAINRATASTKGAKAYLDKDGDLTFRVETIQPSPQDATKAIPRMFSMLDVAMRKVISDMQKEVTEDTPTDVRREAPGDVSTSARHEI